MVDIDIRRWVTEYQAEVVENVNGERFVAPFPEGLVRPIQYGDGIKAHAVYLSQYQLLPFKRIEDYFRDQFALPISSGSLVNFNEEAGRRLEPFGRWAKQNLVDEPVIHADETGVNLSGKRHWLHCLSSDRLTLFEVHAARGSEAMDAMGVLPIYTGVAVHDHWSPYFKYNCVHAMCNAHHLRELQRAWEQDGQRWAQRMHALLIEINKAVSDAGGALDAVDATRFRARYRRLLAKADLECPPPDESQRNGRRGRLRRSKARNLLERLRNLEAETLRFMIERNVPFTNNMGYAARGIAHVMPRP